METKKKYAYLDVINRKLYQLHKGMLDSWHQLEVEEVVEGARQMAAYNETHKRMRLNNKLTSLRKRKRQRDNAEGGRGRETETQIHKFNDRICNLSLVKFAKREVTVLERGLGHSCGSINTSDIGVMAVEVDVALEGTDLTSRRKNEIRTKIAQKINENKRMIYRENEKNKREWKELQSIKEKIKENNLVLTRADKGATIVILKKDDYNAKMNTFLQEQGIKEIKGNPTIKYTERTKQICKNHMDTIKKYTQKNLIPPNPRVPTMYGQVKLHKEDLPIRPIVTTIGSPGEKLSKLLVQIIKNMGFKPQRGINNRTQLIDSLREYKVETNDRLVSFDVENLFPSVPKQETIEIIQRYLDKEVSDINERSALRQILEHTTQQDFFKYNGKMYKQEEGLSMGSSLSPLLAEFFMDNIENRIFDTNNRFTRSIGMWKRYVDDIFCIWKGTEEELQIALSKMNEIHHRIKFTVEMEQNGALNFLDLKVIRTMNEIHFEVYRKPTQTDCIIGKDSKHPEQQKLASINAYTERLLQIPMKKEAYQREIKIIEDIAKRNGYKKEVVEKTIKRKLRRRELRSETELRMEGETKRTEWKTLTYLGPITQKVGNILEKEIGSLKIAYRTVNTIKNSVYNAKEGIEKLEKNGVYEIKCGECDATYVGQTCRKLGIRIKEHINRPDKSTFGRHIKMTGHQFDPKDNSKLLHQENRGKKLTLMEQMEIDNLLRKENVKPLNTQKELYLSYTPLYELINLKQRNTKEKVEEEELEEIGVG